MFPQNLSFILCTLVEQCTYIKYINIFNFQPSHLADSQPNKDKNLAPTCDWSMVWFEVTGAGGRQVS